MVIESTDASWSITARRARLSAAQLRSVAAALDLFGEFGVSATSFQMVADAIGVTKAAVYHQFKTKNALVLAVAEVELSSLEEAVNLAEAEPSRPAARALLLAKVIDMAVVRRRWVNALQGDPVMIRLLGSHEPFVTLMARLYALLLDEGADPGSRVRTAIVSSAIGGAIVHPLVTELDDDTLRAELLNVTKRFFDLTD
ncbi:MAG TPA: TetR/AcrR family transcriptional regulator [Acidimicrobiales bacterium]|jgi:AcrR family transcriptional regulator|nr:TetR/AcrR family transcriptional regulator [Acidimicrobiales bacterium]